MMRLLFLIVASTCFLQAQSFNTFLNRLYSTPQDAKPALVDSFLAAQRSFPVIEQDSLVYFIYTGEATSVSVPSDANQWDASSDRMSRVYGTNLWYLAKKYEPDARLDYKFVTNGSNWILDPRNPNTCLGGFGPNSELRMPAYQFPEEINYRSAIPHGSFFDTTFYSVNLSNSRQVRVYLPPDWSTHADSCGLLVFHDGLEFVSLAAANNVLDYLLWQQAIEPVIAVFIPPVNRTPEYAGYQRSQFTDFIIQEIMPWLLKKYPIYRSPRWHATVGASNGGNIALWLGVSHPEIFGKVAAFSSNVQSDISNLIATSPPLPLAFYLDIGTYDIAVLIPLVRNLKNLLEERGYPLEYHEWHEGHSWGNWRAHVDDVLRLFFAKSSGVESIGILAPQQFRVTSYPNPFNSQTVFHFSLPQKGKVDLEIFDLQGRLVDHLISEDLPGGDYIRHWKPIDLASGVYIYRLQYLRRIYSGKMLFMK